MKKKRNSQMDLEKETAKIYAARAKRFGILIDVFVGKPPNSKL